MGELDAQDRRLEGVQAEIAADHVMMVALPHPVVAQGPDFIGHGLIAADDHAAVAESPKILGREEGVETAFPHGAAFPRPRPAGILRAERLRRVLDDRDPMLGGDGADFVHLAALAEEVNGDNGLYLLPSMGFQTLAQRVGREVERGGLNIGKENPGAEARNAACSGEERVGSGDDSVSRPDAQGHEDRQFGIGARGDADGVSGTGIFANFAFEGFNLGAEDELLGIGDLIHFGADLAA